MIGYLGHFVLDFFGQIWTQETLSHILEIANGYPHGGIHVYHV